MLDELEHQVAALELLTRELIAITDSERLAALAREIGRGLREAEDLDQAVAHGRALSILDCVLIPADDSLEIPMPPQEPLSRRTGGRMRAAMR
jgi:hypothetical protein